MSHDLCSPFHCNICLMLKSHQTPEDGKYSKSQDNLSFCQLLCCSGCQLIRYCNRQHQKLDWPLHGEFCQAVQKIKQNLNIKHPFLINGQPKTLEELEKCIVQLKYLLKNALGRSLEFQEEELSSFPVFCGQCFKFKQLKIVCPDCNSQVYCTEQHREEHKEKHAKFCNLLKIYYCPFKVQPAKEDLCLIQNCKITELADMDLLQCFEKVFALKLPSDPTKSLKNYQLFAWAADFSCIMSICYAINHLDKLFTNLTKFTIFILGASIEPVLWFREIHCKMFFLQNPQISELVLEFIGPEVVEPAENSLKFNLLGKERIVRFKIFNGLFQDYCKYYQVKPSLMVAFNCGFSEFSQCYNLTPTITSLNALEPLDPPTNNINAKDTWFPGLIEILQTFDTPIVFTSFTEQESQFDFAALQNAAQKQSLKVHIDRLFKVAKNPFHDLRPLRQWYTRDKEEFYYRNGYIQAIRTRLQK
ncbi:uncharacterized protein LOC119614701 [Lucilia sericata]|uniref:uncharacterized protein LOC119614701 n=1 Tax=Lucilia sericata TaxID=13632 RepID=UPI0018A859F0|nr:uncharacterized protein LOC119614701 [Lucilia sericata]